MESINERLDPIRSFTVNSFRLEEERWRGFVSQEANQVIFNSFCNAQDYCNLFIYLNPESGLSVNLNFPKNIQTKVICVSKTYREALTKENYRKILLIQEVKGDDVLSFIISVTEQVICPLLSNPKNTSSWAVGVADEALKFMELQKNKALVMKAQIEGHTYLPYPDALHVDDNPDESHLDDGLHRDHDRHDVDLQDDNLRVDTVQDGILNESALQDDDSSVDPQNGVDVCKEDHHGDSEAGIIKDMKLLHACDGTIIEWAELVSEFLQQDSSQLVLDGMKPLPSDEFHFWNHRLKNLLFIQQQLMSSSAQQVASVVQKLDSIYWDMLRHIYRQVQEGVKEAKDVTVNLEPLQEKLKQVEQMEFQQSRKLLRGKEVLHGLLSNPGLVLDDVRLVIQTLQTFKDEYSRVRSQLEDLNQDRVCQSWNFPPYLVFLHLDNFLKRLRSIQEVLCVSLQMEQLDQTVLSGVSGHCWTVIVQGVYQDFLHNVTILSECNSDPTDPNDHLFEQHLGQFQVQVSDLEKQLVSIFSKAFKDCSNSSSAAKLVKMFRFILNQPVIFEQLRPYLIQLKKMVLEELDQTELLFCSQREKSERFSRFIPTPAARLCWTQQLLLRAEDSMRSYRAVEHLCMDSEDTQQVMDRFRQIVNLLQLFRDRVRSDWSTQLDSDCGVILKQTLIQHNDQGMLEVGCSHKLESVLREFRYVSRDRDVELGPHTSPLFTSRDDITQCYRNLSHMVACYNQVLADVLQVELPLIQDQLQDLYQTLSDLQKSSWGSEAVQQVLQQQTEKVQIFHSTVSEARANMDAITQIIKGWTQLHLLQRSDQSLLEDGVSEQSCKQLRDDGQELLQLTQVNKTLYTAADSCESWVRYLDHIDAQVQDGLFQLLLRSLHFLSENTNPQSCRAALFAVSLQLPETGSVFEPSVGDGLCDHLKGIICDVYAAASLLPRISAGDNVNYQVSLQQNPELSALEQEVMCHLLQVREEAEHLRAELDKYAHLWQSDRNVVMQEFLTYSRKLGPEDLDTEETPPTLKDFRREIESLHRLSKEVSHLDEVIVVHGWLQVDLRPFRDSLLSLIQDWKNMYTQHLLDSVGHSLQQVSQHTAAEESSSSSRLPLTETILLLEGAGVELPEHLSAQLQC
ncbi:Dynein heavy chain 17 [Channa argus]|uniref:Dynein heavy chain 17 n=2 Tax=Channa argus TaxID=215402 RepID=A0A6G1Q7G5_CHAAH|nr:Dynein heavy chain 17 [Channa argus]